MAGAALIPGFGEMATTLQGYFVTQAGGGDPNGVFLRGGGGGGDGVFAPIRWPRAFVEGDGLGGTLDVGVDGFKIFVDDQVSRNVCGFLRDVAVEVTDLGGKVRYFFLRCFDFVCIKMDDLIANPFFLFLKKHRIRTACCERSLLIY